MDPNFDMGTEVGRGDVCLKHCREKATSQHHEGRPRWWLQFL